MATGFEIRASVPASRYRTDQTSPCTVIAESYAPIEIIEKVQYLKAWTFSMAQHTGHGTITGTSRHKTR